MGVVLLVSAIILSYILQCGALEGFMMQKSGPYNIEVERVMLCKDQGTNALNITAKIYRKEGKEKIYLYRGAFTVPENQDDFHVSIDIYKWSSGWLLAYSHKDTACNMALKIFKDTFYDLCDAAGIEHTCPLPTGQIQYNDWEVKGTLPPPILEYGKYRALARFVTGDQLIGCLEVIADIKPK